MEVLNEVQLVSISVRLFCSQSHSEEPPKGLKPALYTFKYKDFNELCTKQAKEVMESREIRDPKALER